MFARFTRKMLAGIGNTAHKKRALGNETVLESAASQRYQEESGMRLDCGGRLKNHERLTKNVSLAVCELAYGMRQAQYACLANCWLASKKIDASASKERLLNGCLPSPQWIKGSSPTNTYVGQ